MNTAILSVIYHEPEWIKTCICLSACPQYPVYFVDRGGIGSLAEAFNCGFHDHQLQRYKFVWFLTNVTFKPGVLPRLIDEMERDHDYVAITPAFQSDHPHTRAIPGSEETMPVPFVEFTAPLVLASVFYRHKLDSSMPYSGHDLDWGYRMRQEGLKLGVCHGVTVEHTYIRHSKSDHPATVKRARLRQANEAPTKEKLRQKYGDDWFDKLRCHY